MELAGTRSLLRGVAAALLALPTAYMLFLTWKIRRQTTSCASLRGLQQNASILNERSLPADPVTLPNDVKLDDGSRWVVAFERVVSQPISTRSLKCGSETHSSPGPSTLMRDYLRGAHAAFSWTPQALLIRALIAEPDIRRSFTSDWIGSLDFAPGDLVNGVYRVSHHEKRQGSASEILELLFEVPASYKGPAVRGLLVTAIEPLTTTDATTGGTLLSTQDYVVFANETWMWRRVDEAPTMLETPFGKWFHGSMAGWLVLRGIDKVACSKLKKQ